MPIQELLDYFNQPGSQAASHLQIAREGTHGYFRGLRLSSVFQPLFAPHSHQPSAHEALLRVHDAAGNPWSPAAAFAVPATSEEAVYFDRLCRIVHALNFMRQAAPGADLFVNVSGRHLLGITNRGHGEIFERLLHMCGLDPSQIILEILEARVDDISWLNEAVAAYRARGYRVAIDDFGCEHSNFDRLWRLTPDIVKLDRSLILQGISNPRARRILPKIIEIIHELGALVVCEGIETRDQHHLATNAGADLLQGYFYARPSPTIAGHQPAVAATVPLHA